MSAIFIGPSLSMAAPPHAGCAEEAHDARGFDRPIESSTGFAMATVMRSLCSQNAVQRKNEVKDLRLNQQ